MPRRSVRPICDAEDAKWCSRVTARFDPESLVGGSAQIVVGDIVHVACIIRRWGQRRQVHEDSGLHQALNVGFGGRVSDAEATRQVRHANKGRVEQRVHDLTQSFAAADTMDPSLVSGLGLQQIVAALDGIFRLSDSGNSLDSPAWSAAR